MRKQLHEIQDIDRYIFHTMTGADRLVFQAKMILQPQLKEKVRWQRKVYAFLQWASRKKKKEELTSLHTRLMNDASFNSRITSIFS